MVVTNSVINESIWVAMGETDAEGLAKFRVYNGDWYGVVDFRNRVFWSDRFPDKHNPLNTIRPAVTGECEPYY